MDEFGFMFVDIENEEIHFCRPEYFKDTPLEGLVRQWVTIPNDDYITIEIDDLDDETNGETVDKIMRLVEDKLLNTSLWYIVPAIHLLTANGVGIIFENDEIPLIRSKVLRLIRAFALGIFDESLIDVAFSQEQSFKKLFI